MMPMLGRSRWQVSSPQSSFQNLLWLGVWHLLASMLQMFQAASCRSSTRQALGLYTPSTSCVSSACWAGTLLDLLIAGSVR